MPERNWSKEEADRRDSDKVMNDIRAKIAQYVNTGKR